MYAMVILRVPLGQRLAVPEDAVLDSGMRKRVFVDRGDGMLEPREVRVGTRAGGYFEVLEGLTAGERVVTSASFLIDSESKLQAALARSHSH
jgi:Cu(I)/Ag(I) efflux system membrane fusion protein